MGSRNGPDAQAVVDGLAGIAPRIVTISRGSAYRTFGLLIGTEPGDIDNRPADEEPLLRSRLFPYWGADASRSGRLEVLARRL